MIQETTWHRVVEKQTNFQWEAVAAGINLRHSDSSYTIPWATFQTVYRQAEQMASKSNGTVIAGMSMDNPTPNSVGAWVQSQKLSISNGHLTPRHLSFIGPILGRMGFIDRKLSGNSILWIITRPIG